MNCSYNNDQLTDNQLTNCICYHLVIVTNYRKKVIDDAALDVLSKLFNSYNRKYRVVLKDISHGQDHIHILFETPAVCEVGNFILEYKELSGEYLREVFPQLRNEL